MEEIISINISKSDLDFLIAELRRGREGALESASNFLMNDLVDKAKCNASRSQRFGNLIHDLELRRSIAGK